MKVHILIYVSLQISAFGYLNIKITNQNNQWLIANALLTTILYIWTCLKPLTSHIKDVNINSKRNLKYQTNDKSLNQTSNVPTQQQQLGFDTHKNYQQSVSNQIQSTSLNQQFCTICNKQTLLRMKHCEKCQICIATFDHHCALFIDKCVGQKNRGLFYLLILFQTYQFIYALILIVKKMYDNGYSQKDDAMFLSLLLILVFLIGTLLLFHTYFMLKNITTYQFLRWDKIQYLKNIDKKKGHPCSKNMISNIVDFWVQTFTKTQKIWTIGTQ